MALHLPVLHGQPSEQVVQLHGLDGGHGLLVLAGLGSWSVSREGVFICFRNLTTTYPVVDVRAAVAPVVDQVAVARVEAAPVRGGHPRQPQLPHPEHGRSPIGKLFVTNNLTNNFLNLDD